MTTTSNKQFKTTSTEVAALIEHRTGITPELIHEQGAVLVTLAFPSTPDVLQAAIDFASGCPEARLLAVRTRLYRRIREVRP